MVDKENLHTSIFLQKVLAIIEETVTDKSHLRDLAERSYWHPNGFLKLRLRQLTDGTIIRVHRWREAPLIKTLAQSQLDIHTHRWKFKSYVADGHLRIQEFVEQADIGEIYKKYECLPNNSGSYTLRSLGNSRLMLSNNYQISTGESYVTDLETLHMVVPNKFGATTVIHQGQAESSSSIIYRDSTLEQNNLVARQEVRNISDNDVVQELLCLKRLIKNKVGK